MQGRRGVGHAALERRDRVVGTRCAFALPTKLSAFSAGEKEGGTSGRSAGGLRFAS
jgi:hypothetical protein